MSKVNKAGNELTSRSAEQLNAGDELRGVLLDVLPQLGEKWDVHLPLFTTAPALARQLWLNSLYEQLLPVPGIIVEFGCQWGASLNTFAMLKLIHEPWNISRKIVGFSYFEEGFVATNPEDGEHVVKGGYAVQDGWGRRLSQILRAHCASSPIGAERNYGVVQGDALEEFSIYLKSHPETLISLVHFDLDLYQPTKALISLCLSRMVKGSIIVFDELNCEAFPGETQALLESFDLNRITLRKSKYQPYSAFLVVG